MAQTDKTNGLVRPFGMSLLTRIIEPSVMAGSTLVKLETLKKDGTSSIDSVKD